MDQIRIPEGIRNGLVAVFVIAVLALLIKLGTDQMAIRSLDRDTAAKLEQAQKIRAEHNRRLVSIYEPALVACLNGIGFIVGQAVVLCDVTQVSP